MEKLLKNQIYTADIEGYTSQALGVARIKGQAVFVPGALEGERWEVRITKVSASTVYARGERLLVSSPDRAEPDCRCFGSCGGCQTRHMSYDEELRFKLGRVNDALTHIGRQSVRADSITGSAEIGRYRNKGIFAVAEVKGEPRFGFFRSRSHELIPVERCLIQNELSERAAEAVTRFMKEHNIPAYRESDGEGLVRHVFCRRALHTGDAVVCIVASGGFGSRTRALVERLRGACPELTGIVLNVNRTVGNTVLEGDFYTLWGAADMRDTLCDLDFVISPQAFFQINPPQAQLLYQKAVDYAAPERMGLVFELYCGAGTISLCLAAHADRVIAAEIVPEAIENAKDNAARNGVTNVEFICADAFDAAQTLLARGLRPDVAVVDPPRRGMDVAAIKAVASMSPERIVYVSCNPSTLARDILEFSTLGYSLRDVSCVDMFPRTCHVECVALMTAEIR